MQLIELIIENFQGIEQKTSVKVRDFNVLVGRNDVGKSTILKALDLFLNDRTPSQDSSCLYSGSTKIIIEAVFISERQKIIIDENIETTFEDEELVCENGAVHVRKFWDTQQSKSKAQVSIYRKQYSQNDFFLMTESQMLTLCRNQGIDTHKANGQEFNNTEKRSKLRSHLVLNNVATTYCYETLPSSGSNRAKKVYDALRDVLPRFEFFKADTSLSETDTSIQNYFRDIAKAAIEEFGVEPLENAINLQLRTVLDKVAQKINATVPTDEAVRPKTEFDWSKVVKTAFITGQEDVAVPLSMRGDGFRRITMMAYFEHLAEENRQEEKKVIFGFEEPETFLHPRAQEQLFEKLRAMSSNGYQIFISSHSPIIVASAKQEELIHVQKQEGRTLISCLVVDLVPIAEDLGISVKNQFVNLFDKAKVLLLVEGIDDALALEHVAEQYKQNSMIDKTFGELDIALIPIGGCGSIQHWVTLDLLKKLTKPYFIFLDSDANGPEVKSPNRDKLIELGFIENIHFVVTRKRMLENYIPCQALNRFVPGANLNYGDWDHVKEICKQHRSAGALGGKSVAEKHFRKLSFNDLLQTYRSSLNTEDEFLQLYGRVCAFLS